jgi:uncharacterized membrane-anchored protein
LAEGEKNDYRRTDGCHGFDPLSKVPWVTLMFWVIKIFATTLGETGGDAVTMTLKVLTSVLL